MAGDASRFHHFLAAALAALGLCLFRRKRRREGKDGHHQQSLWRPGK